jgi:predicted metal-dependent phosphoesterase TrpH
MIPTVDLHTHTRASDGTLSPEELVAHALESVAHSRLAAIAITDHDILSGISAAERAARGTALEVVPGVEISASHAGAEVHLLGYFVEESPELVALLARRRTEREQRAREIVSRLNALDVAVEYEEIVQQAAGGAVGRPHVAAVLVARGHVRDRHEAFERWLGDGRPAAVPKPLFPLARAIEIVRDAGAVPVLAHPGLLRHPELLPEIAEMGLAGIEVFYPKHHPEQIQELLSFAQERDLVPTGGSDFHSPGQPAPLGSQMVPAEVLEELRSRSLRRSGV